MIPDESNVLCSLKDVVKHFPGTSVSVGPVSLELHKGEAVGIRGVNGAGKSTLLHMISGVIKPDLGNIIFSKEAESGVALVPQELSLYETLSLRDNLVFWGSAVNLTRKQIKIRSEWLMKELNLTFWADHRVCDCSGGTKRRLHLATALMRIPKILLLDEPSVGADDESAKLILKTIQHLKTLGIGILFISHRQGEPESVCDRILVLENGVFTS